MKKFDRCQKEYGVTDDILFDAQRILTLDMYAGDLIPGTGGAWKLRCGSDDRGKRRHLKGQPVQQPEGRP